MPSDPDRPTLLAPPDEGPEPRVPTRETMVPERILSPDELETERQSGPTPSPPTAEEAPAVPAWAVRPDPMAAAEAALARAREVRGVPVETPPVEPRAPSASPVRDPFAAAEAALAKAREARGLPSADGTPVRSTDRALALARAEAELRRLKRDAGLDED